jgi:hypothetical protein
VPTATPLPTATPTDTPTPTDVSPPEILRFTSPGTACVRRAIDLAVLATDDVGVVGVVVDWTHEDGNSGSENLEDQGNNIFTGTVGPVTSAGDLVAIATARDAAGNTASQTLVVPVVLCLGLSG